MLVEVDVVPPSVVEWCRGWDLGASASGDFTAGGKVGRLADGRYVIAGMVQEQFETNERDALILTTARNDGRMLKQSLPQDPGQAGKSQVAASAKLSCWPGTTCTSRQSQGTRWCGRRRWLARSMQGKCWRWVAHGCSRSGMSAGSSRMGTFDDQVDAVARGFNGLLAPNAGIYS